MQTDFNNGAVDYLTREDAIADKVVEAHETHAILRTGSRSSKRYKRNSAKLRSNRAWTYMLMAMKFSHTPWGCGLWPAFWTHAPGWRWPEGGELDILEYVNDFPSQTSFHTGAKNKCTMDGGVVNMPYCQPMPDLNGMNYDCTTRYPKQLGCAPNKLPLWSPYEWAHNPSVIAVQWTERFIKVFVIPERDIPADLESDDPYPDGWDRWLVAWYPFALSNERRPGTCANPGKVMEPQNLIININFCGDWAGKVWPFSGSCVNRVGPQFPLQCRAVDPLLDWGPNRSSDDCCTQFIVDEEGKYGADEYLRERAYFNMSWIKVYKPTD